MNDDETWTITIKGREARNVLLRYLGTAQTVFHANAQPDYELKQRLTPEMYKARLDAAARRREIVDEIIRQLQ